MHNVCTGRWKPSTLACRKCALSINKRWEITMIMSFTNASSVHQTKATSVDSTFRRLRIHVGEVRIHLCFVICTVPPIDVKLHWIPGHPVFSLGESIYISSLWTVSVVSIYSIPKLQNRKIKSILNRESLLADSSLWMGAVQLGNILPKKHWPLKNVW